MSMENSKQYILNSLRKHTVENFPMPDITVNHVVYEDKIKQFITMCEGVGGRAEILMEGESIDDAIRRIYPDAESIASNLSKVGIATFNPDDLHTPSELNGTDLVVMKGIFGVCENAAVYYEQSYRHRAIYFISERMLIILDKNQLVDTMHDAYARIPSEYTAEYRGFISGPSKTADIEQALVKGAHGARECVVLLV